MSTSDLPVAGGTAVARSGVLLAGAVLSGSFAAAAMWLAGRALGLVAFEALAQLWTFWGLVAIGVAFAFQQWEVSRSLDLPASRRLRMPPGVRIGLVAAGMVVLLLTHVFRVRIFGSASEAWPLAAASLPLGTALTGMAYATLARAGRLQALALVMAAENGARLIMTWVLASVGAPSVAFSLTVPAGFLVAALPLLITPAVKPTLGRGSRLTQQLPALAVVGSATSLLVFGGPLLLGAAGGQAAVVSALFLVLIVPRVPFLLVTSLVPALIVAGTASVVTGHIVRVRRWVLLLVGGGTGLAILVGPLAYALADPTADALFQAGGVIEPVAYGLLAVAVALMLTLTLTNPLLIAMGRLNALVRTWSIVAFSGATLSALGTIDEPVRLTAWMSVCAAAVVAVHLAMALVTKPKP